MKLWLAFLTMLLLHDARLLVSYPGLELCYIHLIAEHVSHFTLALGSDI
jgi:hypothetical protein